MVKIREQVKAIISGGIAGLGALGTALTDGTVTQQEWTTVALATLVAYGLVYGVGQPAQLSQIPRLPAADLRDWLATTKTGDIMAIAANRLSTSEAVTLAQRVGDREDRERAR